MDKADLVHIYNVFHYSAMEKIELMAIAAIWLDLQIVMLNEMSQTEKKIWYCYMWNLKKWYKCEVKVNVLVAQSCLVLCDPTDCSLPGFSVLGNLQARILGWVAIPFSKRSSWLRDWTRVSIIAGGFFTVWATRKPRYKCTYLQNRNRITDVKNKLMATKMESGERDKLEDWNEHIHTTVYEASLVAQW